MPDDVRPDAVVTARPGDTVIFVMHRATDARRLAHYADVTREHIGRDVKVLFIAGVDKVVHLPADEGTSDA